MLKFKTKGDLTMSQNAVKVQIQKIDAATDAKDRISSKEKLASVTERIKISAGKNPEEYLNSAIVPEGGE